MADKLVDFFSDKTFANNTTFTSISANQHLKKCKYYINLHMQTFLIFLFVNRSDFFPGLTGITV